LLLPIPGARGEPCGASFLTRVSSPARRRRYCALGTFL